MNFNEYQDAASSTAIYPEAGSGNFNAVSYAVLGLVNEGGEVAGKLKKIWRDADGVITEEHRHAIAAEVGDVLWYIAAVAREIDIPMEDMASGNVAKLFSRQQRGVIGGSGDTR